MKKKCRSYEALENEYKDFFPINEVTGTQSDGYIINFPVYIQAARDAHVLCMFDRAERDIVTDVVSFFTQ